MHVKTIVQNVQDILRRPDMQKQVEARVRGAIHWAHKSDYYIRDRITQIQVVQDPAKVMRLQLPPRWRQFEVIRPLDITGNPITLCTDTPDQLGYQEIDPRTLRDYRGQDERNYFYVAGDVLNIVSDVEPYQFFFMYYALPDVRDEDALTWITEQYQDLIEHRALSVLYSMLGNMELRNTHKQLENELLEQMKDNAFQSGGAQ